MSRITDGRIVMRPDNGERPPKGMRSGSKIIIRDCFRAHGEIGGWRWEELHGEIISFSMHFKSAMCHVQTSRGNWIHRCYKIDRIRLEEDCSSR